MKFNQFLFMSEIAQIKTDDIVRDAAAKHINTVIVAIPKATDFELFKSFIKKLDGYDIPYDTFLPNFDTTLLEYSLKITRELGCSKIWLKINEGRPSFDPIIMDKLLNKDENKGIDIAIVSQIPYFFRPGTTTHKILSYLSPTVGVSPIISLDMRVQDSGYIQKAITTLASKYKTIPSLYYDPENGNSSDDEIVEFVNKTVISFCNEANFLNWKGTTSPKFDNIFNKIYAIPQKQTERINIMKQTPVSSKKKSASRKFPKEMVVLSKTLGKRTSPSTRSAVLGNLHQGEFINVKSIFADMDGIVYAEVISSSGNNYFVIAEKNGEKTIQNS